MESLMLKIDAIDKFLFLNVLLPNELPAPLPVVVQPEAKKQVKPPAKKVKGKQPVEPIVPVRPDLTPLQKIKKMLSYNVSEDPYEY
jgi:hypothetical protein